MSASLMSRSAGIRVLLEQIRTHEQMRGKRRSLSWADTANYINKLNPPHQFNHQVYRLWFLNANRAVDVRVVINLENFVQHFDKYTDRGARSAARAAARRILDEEINLGDETEREDQDMTTVDDTQTQNCYYNNANNNLLMMMIMIFFLPFSPKNTIILNNAKILQTL